MYDCTKKNVTLGQYQFTSLFVRIVSRCHKELLKGQWQPWWLLNYPSFSRIKCFFSNIYWLSSSFIFANFFLSSVGHKTSMPNPNLLATPMNTMTKSRNNPTQNIFYYKLLWHIVTVFNQKYYYIKFRLLYNNIHIFPHAIIGSNNE